MVLPNKWTVEDVLELTFFKSINSLVVKSIVENFDSLGSFLQTAPEHPLMQKLRLNGFFGNIRDMARNELERQLSECEKNQVKIVPYWSDEYPALLKEIYYAPAIIFVKGTLQRSDAQSISIVGTRRCTVYGRLTTENFARTFANCGIIVTSGLAYGIDQTAHSTAIEAGGVTYAVIASGIDCILPLDANKKANKIIDSGGAIISEYKCGTKAQTGYFPQRNRIISGISKAVLVVESGVKGGALITAKFALEQSREVFAVPGNISLEKCKGTNLLIKSSEAVPALSPESMLEDLGFIGKKGFFEDNKPRLEDKTERLIFDCLNSEPIHIDRLAELSSLDISTLMVKLLDLEFRGIVRRLPGNNYIKSHNN